MRRSSLDRALFPLDLVPHSLGGQNSLSSWASLVSIMVAPCNAAATVWPATPSHTLCVCTPILPSCLLIRCVDWFIYLQWLVSRPWWLSQLQPGRLEVPTSLAEPTLLPSSTLQALSCALTLCHGVFLPLFRDEIPVLIFSSHRHVKFLMELDALCYGATLGSMCAPLPRCVRWALSVHAPDSWASVAALRSTPSED